MPYRCQVAALPYDRAMMDDGDKSISLSGTAEQGVSAAEIDQTVDDRAPEAIDPQHRAAVVEGLRQSKAGLFASKKDLEAVLQRLRS